ncbi:unnamed protein product [Choristocarpus tenellus]
MPEATESPPGVGSGDGGNNHPSIFSSPGLSAGAFLKSPYHSYPPGSSPAPDIQVTVFPRVVEPHILAQAHLRPSPDDPPMMLVTVSLLDPEGRSAVCLDPEHPKDQPPHICRYRRPRTVEPRSPTDLKKLAWGVARVREIMNTEPLKNLTMGEVYPGPEVGESASSRDDAVGAGAGDPALMQWIEDHIYSNSHWCGTARMGGEGVEGAVVDKNMAVKGSRGLVVADASVIPFIPNGNVHSTVVLMAVRAAEMLLEERARDKGAV